MAIETVENISLEKVFNTEHFQEECKKIVDILYKHIKECQSESIPATKYRKPDEVLADWDFDFEEVGEGLEALQSYLERFVEGSCHLQHPHYMGHQVAVPMPLAAISTLVTTFLNSTSAVYEMGAISVALEATLLKWLAKQFGYSSSANGFFTSGGSLGNITALLTARQVKSGYDVWNEGVKGDLAIMISDQNHYCVSRAAKIMGLGEEGTIKLATDSQNKIDLSKLEESLEKAKAKGKKVFALVANACSTATGSFDNLEVLGKFCQKHDLWFHVDGAHGASSIFSKKYKDLLKGIELADSIVWDAHKMCMIPSPCTTVIYKNGSDSFRTFSQDASYLMGKDPESEWFNIAHRSVECTKPTMALKPYLALKLYGTQIFEKYIDKTYDLAREFAELLRSREDFELAIEPEANIVCFRYLPGGKAKAEGLDLESLNELQTKIRKELLSEGNFYIVQTNLRAGTFLRVSLMNPLTAIEHMKALLEEITKIATKV